MIEQHPKLGKLVSIHPVSPESLQRAVIVLVLSFLFFLGMMLVFYNSRNLLYFLLSTAFLIVYVATLFSWVSMRKNVLMIYENGLKYKNFSARWNEIKPVELKTVSQYFGGEKPQLKITKITGEQITLNESLYNIESAVEKIHSEIS